MQQSNFIFGMILIAYIVFITVRGELPIYISLLRGSGKEGDKKSSDDYSGDLKVGGLTIDSKIQQGIISLPSKIGDPAYFPSPENYFSTH